MNWDPYQDSDVVIVGTGPIGATYARVLLCLDDTIKVTMLDAGPNLSDTPGRHLRNHRVYQDNWNTFADVVAGSVQRFSVPPQDGFQETLDPRAYQYDAAHRYNYNNPLQNRRTNLPYAAGAYGVGGMSTLWTCAVPRPHPTIERSELISEHEWDMMFDAAENFLCRTTEDFDYLRNKAVKKALSDHYRKLPAGYAHPLPTDAEYAVQNLPMAARRRRNGAFGEDDGYVKWTGVDDILRPVLDDPAKRERLAILSEHLVTRLDHSGSKVQSAQVQDFHELTTRTISAEHFVVATGPILGPQLLWRSHIRHSALGRYLNDQPVASCLVVLGQELVEDMQNPHTGKTGIDALPPNAAEPQVWIPVSEHRPWHCQIHQDPINFTTPGGEQVDQRLLVFLQWFGMAEPEESNRVTFSDQYEDLMGMPQPTFEYEMPEKARDRCHQMIDDMAQASLSVGGWLPAQLPQFEPPGASLHLQGTTRMGNSDDGTSVVDTTSKHWGYDNLFVGGIGTIPTATACNPTPTAVALAVKSAASLALHRKDIPKEKYQSLQQHLEVT